MSAPTSSALAKLASVFSGRCAESPRWAMIKGGKGDPGLADDLGLGARARQRPLVDLGLDEDVQQILVELVVLDLVLQDVERPLHRHRLLVGAVPGDQRVEDVRD